MTVNPHTLTLSTALEARYSPSGEKSAICQESSEDAPPVYDPAEEHTSATDYQADMEAVVTKVCGDKHFFHRNCIESWWKSGNPHLNTCPIDRTLCYGGVRVPQEPVNLPTYTTFPGHDPHAHVTVQSDETDAHGTAHSYARYADETDGYLGFISADDRLVITRARDEAFNSMLTPHQRRVIGPIVNNLLNDAIEMVQEYGADPGEEVTEVTINVYLDVWEGLAVGHITREEVELARSITENIMIAAVNRTGILDRAMEYVGAPSPAGPHGDMFGQMVRTGADDADSNHSQPY